MPLVSLWGSTDEVMCIGACRRDTLSPLNELPCDLWVHVLEFLSILDMLRFFQTCQTFCALQERMRTFDFTETRINMVNVLTVVRLLSNGAALTTLNLDNTGIVVAAGLAKAIKASSTLTYLNLASNELYPAEARALARALASSVLKRLNLSDNQICGVHMCGSGTYTSVGINALAEVLKVSSSLKSLDLNGNSIRDEGAVAIAQAAQCNDKLESLGLGRNGIRFAGAIEVAKYIRFSSALQNLDLSSNNLTNWGTDSLKLGITIAEALKVSSDLKNLDMSFNNLNEDAALSIVRAARHQDKVEVLGLAMCRIGSAGAAVLADYISFSSALKNLDLTYNRGIEGESARQLAAAALESKTLEVFSKVPIKDLRENKLTKLKLSAYGHGPAETIVLAKLAEAIVLAKLASYRAIYRVRGADL